MMRSNDLDAAFTRVQALLSKSGDEDISVRIRLMLLKAQIYIKAGRPQKALTLAIRATSTARRTLLMNLLWQAVGTLAVALTSLREFAAAEEILLPVIPRALETDIASLAGDLYTALADARMGLAGLEAPGSEERKERMLGAQWALQQADDLWGDVEDVVRRREGWAKMATIMRIVGALESSDDYARKYVDSMREEGMTFPTRQEINQKPVSEVIHS